MYDYRFPKVRRTVLSVGLPCLCCATGCKIVTAGGGCPTSIHHVVRRQAATLVSSCSTESRHVRMTALAILQARWISIQVKYASAHASASGAGEPYRDIPSKTASLYTSSLGAYGLRRRTWRLLVSTLSGGGGKVIAWRGMGSTSTAARCPVHRTTNSMPTEQASPQFFDIFFCSFIALIRRRNENSRRQPSYTIAARWRSSADKNTRSLRSGPPRWYVVAH